MAPPQTLPLLQFGYTATSSAVAVQPGSWVWQPTRSRVVSCWGSFDSGSGPSGADFTCDVNVNGSPVFAITVPDGDEQGETDVSGVIILNGDIVFFDITADGGSTGPVELEFSYY